LSEADLGRLYGVPVRRVCLSGDGSASVDAVVPLFGKRTAA
jgi:hypothetical protein